MSSRQTIKHLYIHIPFCNHICSYCDFARIQTNNEELKHQYVVKLVQDLQACSHESQYETVYLGGGTPNALSDSDLAYLLTNLQPYLHPGYELSIECNPELVTKSQVQILAQYGVNRVSLGVQTTNNTILKQLNRHHTIEDVAHAIQLFQGVGIDNLSLDFIYNLMNLTMADLDAAIQFIGDHQIKHVSFYALEIKSGSLLKKLKIQIDEEVAEQQLDYLIEQLPLKGFHRYEVSNWALSPDYECRHNKQAYWQFHEWIGLGYGACGYESWNNYQNVGTIQAWHPLAQYNSIKDHEISYLMMNIRLAEGLDLNLPYHAYLFAKYQDKLKYYHIDRNHLVADDLSLLNQTILDLFE